MPVFDITKNALSLHPNLYSIPCLYSSVAYTQLLFVSEANDIAEKNVDTWNVEVTNVKNNVQ